MMKLVSHREKGRELRRYVLFSCLSHTYMDIIIHTLCSVVDCNEPPSPSNASPASTEISTTFGSTVTYVCDNGYQPVGDATIECEASGSWSGQGPNCQGKYMYTVTHTQVQAHAHVCTHVYTRHVHVSM